MSDPYFSDGLVTVHAGDSLDLLRADVLGYEHELGYHPPLIPDASIDAVVTDPPYGLEFMGKAWDSFRTDDPGTTRHRGDYAGVHGEARTDEGRGGFGRIAYGGGKRPTTSRCAACGKRDQFRSHHACGDATEWITELIREDGAPPSMLAFGEWCRQWATECRRVLKPGGHLLAFGGTRTWHRLAAAVEDAGFEVRDSLAWMYGSGFPKSMDVSKAIDKAAGAEREVVGSKLGMPGYSLTDGNGDHRTYGRGLGNTGNGEAECAITAPATNAARQWEGWGTALKPAFEPIVVARKPMAATVAATVLKHGTGALNVAACRIAHADGDDLRESVAKNQHATFGTEPGGNNIYGDYSGTPSKDYDGTAGRWPANVILDEHQAAVLDGTTDRASRFFYTAKPDSGERVRVDGIAHATVKPLALMRWLVRLVTPPGGTVLEPFAGSGTTVEACVLEGFRCLAIEREAEYLPLIRQRIDRRRDPVAAVLAAGGDAGLFDLIEATP